MANLKVFRVCISAFILNLFALHPVWADDTEIYFNSTHGSSVKPNLLFVLDASWSMDNYDCENGARQKRLCSDTSENGNATRLERLVSAMKLVLDNTSNLNVGLMRFGGVDGGRIIYPVTDLDGTGVNGTADVRAEMSAVLDEMQTIIGTPTVGAMEEAMLYYSGGLVKHGLHRAKGHSRIIPRKSRVSHPESYTGGTLQSGSCLPGDLNNNNCSGEIILGAPTYDSPIVSECQSNYMVVLSDGSPWVGGGNSMPAPYLSTIDYIQDSLNNSVACKSVGIAGLCGEELTGYMFREDLSPLPKLQNVITHSIGFNIRSNWIRDLAIAGGGQYYPAESALDLVNAISSIVSSVSDSGATLVAPSVNIDQFSRLSHRKETYLALFKPLATNNWIGNLKKFKLTGSPASLKDADDLEAIDTATGNFKDTSKSFWSAVSDGAKVELGGAASKLIPANRSIVSNLAAGTSSLMSVDNRISTANLTPAMMGASDDAELALFIDWLSGFDVKDEDGDLDYADPRNHIGDPLHSTPVVVTYGVDAGETVDEDNPNEVIFFGTNEGFLHAINSTDGVEEFAFMPRELMPNVAELFANRPVDRTAGKTYGLDGNLTLHTIDKNNNGLIEEALGDKAYIYVGMRRGGQNYYALDVSVKGAPVFMWSRPGGTGDFAELGQTWSKPIYSKIKIGGTEKNVLVFGGGYDPDQDDKNTRTPDSIGRAIFFVDADNGNLVWSGGNPEFHDTPAAPEQQSIPEMTYSIPSDLAVVSNVQGYLSQIYVGDMGGRIWRLDINNGESLNDLVDAGIIADVGDGTVAGARRFYGKPDLSLSKVNGKLVVNIAMGTGYRAHPLNENIKDKFVLYRYPYKGNYDNDQRVYGVQINGTGPYVVPKLTNFFDTTENLIVEGTDDQLDAARDALAKAPGWYISMEDAGEKILDQSSTLEGIVRFISYVPTVSTNPCEPSLGSSYYYAVNLADGSPAADAQDDPDNIEKQYRRRLLPAGGIAAPIATIFVENNGQVTPTDMSGVSAVQSWGDLDLLKRWFWAETTD